MSTPEDFVTQPTPLTPNKLLIGRHLYAVFNPVFANLYPDARIEIAYGLATEGPRHAASFSIFDLRAAAEFAYQKNKELNNVYYGVAARGAGVPLHARSNLTHYQSSSRAWIDFDQPGDAERIDGILKRINLAPSEIAWTGTTPSLRGQAYFRLAQHVSADELRAINKILETLLDSDSVSNADRVMRLAGTISYPSPDKVARGYITEFVKMDFFERAPAYTGVNFSGLIPAQTQGGPSLDDVL